jgi:hypothetical protein
VIARVGAPASSDLATGRTSGWQGQLISEVYVNNRAAYPIAATIYHELLHNRFNLAVNIHGTADGNFTSATAPFNEGGPSAADQRLMCQALQELLLAGQFQGGYSLPVPRRRRSGAPLLSPAVLRVPPRLIQIAAANGCGGYLRCGLMQIVPRLLAG